MKRTKVNLSGKRECDHRWNLHVCTWNWTWRNVRTLFRTCSDLPRILTFAQLSSRHATTGRNNSAWNISQKHSGVIQSDWCIIVIRAERLFYTRLLPTVIGTERELDRRALEIDKRNIKYIDANPRRLEPAICLLCYYSFFIFLYTRHPLRMKTWNSFLYL